MSLEARMSVQGDKGAKRVFAVLIGSHQRKVIKAVVRAQASIITKAAKTQTAKAGYTQSIGATKRSIGHKIKTYRSGKTTNVIAVVGARAGVGERLDPWRGPKSKAGRIRKPIFYFHLLELGTFRSAAKPSLTPALTNTRAEVWRVGKEIMSKEIERIVIAERQKAGAA